MQGEEFVEEAFAGSLPAFVATFTSRKKLSNQDIDELLEIKDDFNKNGAKDTFSVYYQEDF